MKSVSSMTGSNAVRWDASGPTQTSSRFVYGPTTREASGHLPTQSKARSELAVKLPQIHINLYVSKSMERTFRRVDGSKEARIGYVEAEVANSLANQIRILRQQRRWSQKHLAAVLGSTQGVVSRLENPAYGKVSMKTLTALSAAFDVGLSVRFMSFGKFFASTHDVKFRELSALPYEVERQHTQVVLEGAGSKPKLSNMLLIDDVGTASAPYVRVIKMQVGNTATMVVQ